MNPFSKSFSLYYMTSNQNQHDSRKNTKTLSKTNLKKPTLYKVLMLNDDFTPMNFVIYTLETIFRKTTENAVSIMLKIHHNGIGICGIFTYEVAETKVMQVMNLAKQHQYPLQCLLEKE